MRGAVAMRGSGAKSDEHKAVKLGATPRRAARGGSRAATPKTAQALEIAPPETAPVAPPETVPEMAVAAVEGAAGIAAADIAAQPASPDEPQTVASDDAQPVSTDEVPPAVTGVAVPLATPVSTPADIVVPVGAARTGKDGMMNFDTGTIEKTQAMFADLSTRAKGAMEKSAAAFEDANAFAKGNIEAIVESSKIAAKGIETMGQEAAEYGRKQLESATAAMKTLSSVKSPTDFLKLHSEFMRSAFDAMVAETSKNTESMLKLAGEIAQPISNRVALAAEKIKVAA